MTVDKVKDSNADNMKSDFFKMSTQISGVFFGLSLTMFLLAGQVWQYDYPRSHFLLGGRATFYTAIGLTVCGAIYSALSANIKKKSTVTALTMASKYALGFIALIGLLSWGLEMKYIEKCISSDLKICTASSTNTN